MEQRQREETGHAVDAITSLDKDLDDTRAQWAGQPVSSPRRVDYSTAASTVTIAVEESLAPCDEKAPSQPPSVGPPPDGGLVAWSQVLAGHLVAFNAWGFPISFGIFQAYLTTALARQPSDISWIGSVQIFLMLLLGVVSGRALDAGYYRPCAIAGLVLQAVGIMTASFATAYWQLLLAFGVCQGIGNGLVFTPTMAVVSTYFAKKRAVAVMGMSSGTATGGVVFPLVARQLLDKIGFGWTVRVMGFIFLLNAVIAVLLIRPRLPPRASGPLVELKSFRDPWYSCCTFGLFFITLGLYFGYFYIPSFTQDIIHASSTTSYDVLLVTNAMGVPGRFIPAYLSDRWLGPLNTILISATMACLSNFAWAGVGDLGGTWAFAVVFGFFGSSISTFFPSALANAGRELTKMGVEIGMCFSLIGLSCLIGPPIAGALITNDHGNYYDAQIFASIAMLIGVALVMAARYISVGSTLVVRV